MFVPLLILSVSFDRHDIFIFKVVVDETENHTSSGGIVSPFQKETLLS